MSGEWVFDRESFWDFLGYVLEYAPNFPEEDYLEATEQLNVSKAFAELQHGLSIMRTQLTADAFTRSQLLLEQSRQAFESGDEFSGSRVLDEFEKVVFPDKR